MHNFHTGWYLLYTKPRHEKKVFSGLTEMDIKSFLPTKKTLRIWHDRKKIVNEPLFPSYVFIYLDTVQRYYDSIDTEGVLYCVRSGKELARVNDSIVDNIRLATEKDTDLEVSTDHFQPGQRMVIREGALTGLSCEVVKIKEKKKLLIRLDMMQRNLLITLPAESLIAI